MTHGSRCTLTQLLKISDLPSFSHLFQTLSVESQVNVKNWFVKLVIMSETTVRKYSSPNRRTWGLGICISNFLPSCGVPQVKTRLDRLTTINHLWYSWCERGAGWENHTHQPNRIQPDRTPPPPPQFVFFCLQLLQLFLVYDWCNI